jgi:hypothetical protein
MRLIVKQTECAGNLFWIAQDPDHGLGHYHGPFADETAAQAFARAINSEAWRALLRNTRANRKAMVALTAEAALAA